MNTPPDRLESMLDRWGDDLAKSSSVNMPEALAAAVARRARPASPWMRAAPWLAVAATVVLGVGVFWLSRQTPSPAVSPALSPISLAALSRQALEAGGDADAIRWPDGPESARVNPAEVFSPVGLAASR